MVQLVCQDPEERKETLVSQACQARQVLKVTVEFQAYQAEMVCQAKRETWVFKELQVKLELNSFDNL